MRLAAGLLGVFATFALGGCNVAATDDSSASAPHPTATSTPGNARPRGPLLTTSTRDVGSMEASLSAQSDGVTIKVYAALLDNSDFLQTDGGDYFTATVAGETIVLTPEPHTDNVIHYTATFPAVEGPTQVTIAFVRRNGGLGAPRSIVTVPAPFAITSTAPASVKLGDTLSIATTTGFEQTTVDVDGPCIERSGPLPVSSAASFTFDTRSVVPINGGVSCDVSFTVRHAALGKIDPAFKRGVVAALGAIEGVQARKLSTYVNVR